MKQLSQLAHMSLEELIKLVYELFAKIELQKLKIEQLEQEVSKFKLTEQKLSAQVAQQDSDFKKETNELKIENSKLKQENNILKQEVAREKKVPLQPKIAPNRLKRKKQKGSPRKHWKKKAKKLKIDQVITIDVPEEKLSPGTKFMGYKSWISQELILYTWTTQFKLAWFMTPDGRYVCAELPENIKGSHYGNSLKAHIVYQNQFNRVPENKIHKELVDRGISISEGQVHAILEEATKKFAQEKDGLHAAGVQTAHVLHVDDTGARHQGKSGHCTAICNDSFVIYTSTDSKSRINFYEILQGPGEKSYLINKNCYKYLEKHKVKTPLMDLIKDNMGTKFSNEAAVKEWLDSQGVKGKENRRLLKEGMLLAGAYDKGLPRDLILISDGAPQFEINKHGLCWVHAIRNIHKLIPINEEERTEIENFEDRAWSFYDLLKKYQEKPTSTDKTALRKEFDQIFKSQVKSIQLQKVFKSFLRDKKSLLTVLNHPETPLNNNICENDIREIVIKRKISGGTRSSLGRARRDMFTSLSKTCMKNAISFWDFLNDRYQEINAIPYLADLIRKRSQLGASPPI